MLPMVSPFIDSWLSRTVEKNKKLNLITYSCNHLKFDKDAKHTQWRKTVALMVMKNVMRTYIRTDLDPYLSTN